MTGLAYCGIGVGAMIIILAEPLLRRFINSHPKDPKTGQVTPEAAVSIVCIGGVLLAVGQLQRPAHRRQRPPDGAALSGEHHPAGPLEP